MKEIKLTVDGKEVKLTAEQIKALGIDVDDGCVCDRVEGGENYFCIGNRGTVDRIIEAECPIDCEMFEYGNYYRSRSYAKQVAMHQHLNNLLRRYSEQHGGDVEWNGIRGHYFICRDITDSTLYVNCYNVSKICGVVYFNSEKVAKAAIEEVVKPFLAEHPDFVW